MKITIETKFNIGDEVYVIDYYHEPFPRKTPCIITDILLLGRASYPIVRYEIICEDKTETFPESWLFATYEECTKRCKKNN